MSLRSRVESRKPWLGRAICMPRLRPLHNSPRLRFVVLAALAACVLAFVPGSTPHLPASPGEADGNPIGLAGLVFKGPANTAVANQVCPPILDAERPVYGNAGNLHIGHVNGVNGASGYTSNYLDMGSVDLWHFEDDPQGGAYSNPNAIEGPHDPTNAAYSVMLGADGFMRGKMHSTIFNGPGTDLSITDVHPSRTYCTYGSIVHGGPYLFIHATQGDAFTGTQTPLDLSWFYAALFVQEWPNQTVRMDYVFLVSSPYNDPPPPPPPTVTLSFACASPDGPNFDLAPGPPFAAQATSSDNTWPSYEWDFGDGDTGTGANPSHAYDDDGDYTVTVTATTPTGGVTEASRVCSVLNRPPVASFGCPGMGNDGGMTFRAVSSQDPEGPIARYEWDMGDQTVETGRDITHYFPRAGTYTVTLTVLDNDWNSNKPTRAVTSSSVTHDCVIPRAPNHPPVLERVPRQMVPIGSPASFTVTGWDPDGDTPLAYSASGLPPGAQFDPGTQVFTWEPPGLGLYSGLRFRVTDPGLLSDQKSAEILVFDQTSDADEDGISDTGDNCPGTPNRSQEDLDHDGVGDACQDATEAQAKVLAPRRSRSGTVDTDLDGVMDNADGCPDVPDSAQLDLDGDGIGDACDLDMDGDGVPETGGGFRAARPDNCPRMHNPGQADSDHDGRGDACSGQSAGSAVLPDAFPARGRGTQVSSSAWTLQSLGIGLVGLLCGGLLLVAGVILAKRRTAAKKAK